MAAATTYSYHIAGPITLEAFLTGSYQKVGECRDGADILLRPFTHDIKHDGAGGPEGDAAEIIFLNYGAEIRCQLVPYAGTWVNMLRAMSMANGSGTNGVMITPGTPFGQTSNLPAIRFQANATYEVDGGWQFSTCQVVRAGDLKISPVESVVDFGFRAINYIAADSYRTAASIVGNTLYSRI